MLKAFGARWVAGTVARAARRASPHRFLHPSLRTPSASHRAQKHHRRSGASEKLPRSIDYRALREVVKQRFDRDSPPSPGDLHRLVAIVNAVAIEKTSNTTLEARLLMDEVFFSLQRGRYFVFPTGSSASLSLAVSAIVRSQRYIRFNTLLNHSLKRFGQLYESGEGSLADTQLIYAALARLVTSPDFQLRLSPPPALPPPPTQTIANEQESIPPAPAPAQAQAAAAPTTTASSSSLSSSSSSSSSSATTTTSITRRPSDPPLAKIEATTDRANKLLFILEHTRVDPVLLSNATASIQSEIIIAMARTRVLLPSFAGEILSGLLSHWSHNRSQILNSASLIRLLHSLRVLLPYQSPTYHSSATAADGTRDAPAKRATQLAASLTHILATEILEQREHLRNTSLGCQLAGALARLSQEAPAVASSATVAYAVAHLVNLQVHMHVDNHRENHRDHVREQQLDNLKKVLSATHWLNHQLGSRLQQGVWSGRPLVNRWREWLPSVLSCRNVQLRGDTLAASCLAMESLAPPGVEIEVSRGSTTAHPHHHPPGRGDMIKYMLGHEGTQKQLQCPGQEPLFVQIFCSGVWCQSDLWGRHVLFEGVLQQLARGSRTLSAPGDMARLITGCAVCLSHRERFTSAASSPSSPSSLQSGTGRSVYERTLVNTVDALLSVCPTMSYSDTLAATSELKRFLLRDTIATSSLRARSRRRARKATAFPSRPDDESTLTNEHPRDTVLLSPDLARRLGVRVPPDTTAHVPLSHLALVRCLTCTLLERATVLFQGQPQPASQSRLALLLAFIGRSAGTVLTDAFSAPLSHPSYIESIHTELQNARVRLETHAKRLSHAQHKEDTPAARTLSPPPPPPPPTETLLSLLVQVWSLASVDHLVHVPLLTSLVHLHGVKAFRGQSARMLIDVLQPTQALSDESLDVLISSSESFTRALLAPASLRYSLRHELSRLENDELAPKNFIVPGTTYSIDAAFPSFRVAFLFLGRTQWAVDVPPSGQAVGHGRFRIGEILRAGWCPVIVPVAEFVDSPNRQALLVKRLNIARALASGS